MVETLERIDKLQFAARHAFGEELGVIVHGHVKQIVRYQARPAVDFHKPPESLAVFLLKSRIRDAGHEPDEQPDGFGQEKRLLLYELGCDSQGRFFFDPDIE